MGLLKASAAVTMQEVNLGGDGRAGGHGSPVEDDLGVEVADLVEVDFLVALEVLEVVEVNLEAGGDADDSQGHTETATVPDRHGHCRGRVVCDGNRDNGLVVLEGDSVREDFANGSVSTEIGNVETLLDCEGEN